MEKKRHKAIAINAATYDRVNQIALRMSLGREHRISISGLITPTIDALCDELEERLKQEQK